MDENLKFKALIIMTLKCKYIKRENMMLSYSRVFILLFLKALLNIKQLIFNSIYRLENYIFFQNYIFI